MSVQVRVCFKQVRTPWVGRKGTGSHTYLRQFNCTKALAARGTFYQIHIERSMIRAYES